MTKEDHEKDVMNMWSQNRLNCPYHEEQEDEKKTEGLISSLQFS
jgi:hypothetical protein